MNKIKWYRKPWWLIGIGLLFIGSFVGDESFERFLIIVFVVTIILFMIWFYSLLRKRLNKFWSFLATIIITLICFILLLALLNWIKGEWLFGATPTSEYNIPSGSMKGITR